MKSIRLVSPSPKEGQFTGCEKGKDTEPPGPSLVSQAVMRPRVERMKRDLAQHLVWREHLIGSADIMI